MLLRYRLTTAADLPRCLDMVHNSFTHRPDVRDALPRIWAELIEQGAIISAVIEAQYAHGHRALEAVSINAFVSDPFLDEFLARPVPYIALQVYERHMQGRSPLLDSEGIRQANAGAGLNLLILHTGATTNDYTQPSAHVLVEMFREMHIILLSGYRINRVVHEVLGATARGYMQGAGFRLITDYGEHIARSGVPMRDEDHPNLFVTTEADTVPGSAPAIYFRHVTPRFGFSPMQQLVLLHAWCNATDYEIAERLHVSTDTVRKHWRAIYQRVTEVAPHLLPGEHVEGDTRGPEKRRHLLGYLRHHPEELRPYRHPRRRANSRSH